MQEGDTEEDVENSHRDPAHIIKNILANNRKRKADDSVDNRQCKVHASTKERCCGTAGSPTVENKRTWKVIDRLCLRITATGAWRNLPPRLPIVGQTEGPFSALPVL